MIEKISTKQLMIGMYIHQLDRNYLETPFLKHRFLVKNPGQISQLQEYCQFVYIDTEKGIKPKEVPAERGQPVPEPVKTGPVTAPPKSTHHSPAPSDLSRSYAVRNQAKAVIGNTLEDVRLGKIIDTAQVQGAVNAIVESLMEDSEALLCLTQLKNRDEYTVTHSLNVSILSVAFAKQLELPVDDLQMLGLGGLMHDLGKMRVPLEILNKPGKLTEEEFTVMKNHVLLGQEVLLEAGDFPRQALAVVLQHHERFNGKGYPYGLSQNKIDLFGRIAAIVDVYDALTSDRVYHAGMAPHEAIKKIFEWRTDFDPNLVEKFIQTIGIYPLGSLVQINHSDIGVIVSNNPEDLLKPSVLLLLDKNNHKYQPPRLIDLSQKLSDFKPLWVITKIFNSPLKEEYLTHLIQVAGV
ncbi:MAG TPA: HD-GYP domain-containing protein [Thermodesulfobacteriota bacterium]|nr:HD-GYP domain-containing protein [Thermodesulfobacteriota bacterium]